jgi:hypothetical protein
MITKRIKPVIAYGSLGRVQATSFNVRSMEDNLFDSVVFKHTLLTADGLFACDSSDKFNYTTDAVSAFTGINEAGEKTCTWDASPEGAFTIVAQALGFEFEPQSEATKQTFFEG